MGVCLRSEGTEPGQLQTRKSIGNRVINAWYVADHLLFAAMKNRSRTRSMRSGQCERSESQMCTTASLSQ